jgi:hypothetical protein
MIPKYARPDRPPRRHVDAAQRLDLASLKGLLKSPDGEVVTIRSAHLAFQAFPIYVGLARGDQGQPVGLAVHHRTEDGTGSPYSIFLTSTRPYFGGTRFWLSCPGPSGSLRCGTRRQVLYRPFGAPRFACWECHGLRHRDPWARRANAAAEVLIDAAQTPEGRRAIRETFRGPRGRGRK